MQKMFGDFIHALRHAGLPVSQAETLDALQAARLIGLNNPTLLKSGLAMTLAKTREDLAQYEVVFDQFFSVSAVGSENESESESESNNEPDTDQQASSPENEEPANEPAQSSATTNSKNTENLSPLAQQLMTGDQTSIQIAIAAAGEEAGTSSMQMFTQKGVTRYRIMQKLGEGPLNTELAQLDKDNSQLVLVADLRKKQVALREQVKDYVESQFLLYSKKIGANLRDEYLSKVRLSNIDFSYYKHMTSIVRKAAKQLASMHSRRRKVSKRGLLDVRRTIAANAAYDGFLFHTKWKSTRIDKPKVMVICDVSGSVSKMARFLLLFLYSLQDVLPNVRSFVFASDMAEVTDDFKKQEIEGALTTIMNNYANMPTDYGRALLDFKEMALKDINNKTTVIMLGDARNNNGLGQTQVWKDVYEKSQRVLWLNPEGQYNWDSGDSIMSQYRPYCSKVEHVGSLNDLTRILGALLKNS
jgi:uncharacterized protein with von Willebrand factor type A (vWA) domain